MMRAFGKPSSQVFARLSPSPLAAASLGQVYRGQLQPQFGGHEVAVKVQRPGVLLSVAMDMFLMRNLAVFLDSFVCLPTHIFPSITPVLVPGCDSHCAEHQP